MSQKKTLILIALLAILAATALVVRRSALARETATYRFTDVQRGGIRSAVSATGKLSALKTVSVGTQVSGQVAELRVDYNDRVKKGQLLARIDPTLALQAVTDAQANVERARALLVESQRQHARNRELAASGLVARSEVESTESTFDVARATLKSAQVALQKAQQNLAYTNIYAPIDGVVVERNVDQGQTVAASLSAPQLFLIANDPAQMQILADVSESDIARIRQGQAVEFNVQALPDQKFKGTVQQVRLQSTTQENVVNYTVVVSVPNEKSQLLPGMTARVELVTEAKEDILKVANSALRFRPSDEQIAELQAARTSEQAGGTQDSGLRTQDSRSTQDSRRTQDSESPARSRERRGQRGNAGVLYSVDAAGKLQAIRVRTGISDGTTTEVMGKDLTEGTKVIAGTATTRNAESGAPASPFTQNSQQQRRRPGGF